MRDLQILDEQPFYLPFQNSQLIKAAEENGKWVVYLEASNETLDQENEVIAMKALKDASDYYLTHGVISWDHKHKQLNDPSYIIGEPEDVAFTSRNSTLVKGFLYKENKRAQGVWENILSNTTRFGSSVGGYILKKAKEGLSQLVSKVLWDETAITHKPVNDTTLGKVQIIPFTEFVKALMAGSGVDAANFTGGRSLTKEELQGSSHAKRIFFDFMHNLKKGNLFGYDGLVSFVKSYKLDKDLEKQVIDFIYKQVTEKKFNNYKEEVI